jgi:hypothetical protein
MCGGQCESALECKMVLKPANFGRFCPVLYQSNGRGQLWGAPEQPKSMFSLESIDFFPWKTLTFLLCTLLPLNQFLLQSNFQVPHKQQSLLHITTGSVFPVFRVVCRMLSKRVLNLRRCIKRSGVCELRVHARFIRASSASRLRPSPTKSKDLQVTCDLRIIREGPLGGVRTFIEKRLKAAATTLTQIIVAKKICPRRW